MNFRIGSKYKPLAADGWDPLANINLIDDPAKNLMVIMKDGAIYKHIVG